nr:DUF6252 family protein [uncultured Psychroserpens sp.]
MRNLRQFMLFVMTVTLVTLTSCSSDDDGGEAGNAASGVMVAKVDGASFQSLEISSSATVANGGQNLIIIASSTDATAFAFTVLGYDGVGTYPLGGGANIFNSASFTQTDVDLNNPQNSTTEIWQAPYDDTMVGEINVAEETDTKIIGTFSFTCKNVGGDQTVKTITEGSFNLNKQVQ